MGSMRRIGGSRRSDRSITRWSGAPNGCGAGAISRSVWRAGRAFTCLANIRSDGGGSPACGTIAAIVPTMPRQPTPADRSSSRTGRASSARSVRSTDVRTTRLACQPTSCCSSFNSRLVRMAHILSKVHMTKKLLLTLLFATLAGRLFAQGKLTVMTTTEDLASIAREIGGDRVTVDSIPKGYQGPHFVEAKPTLILKLQQAAVLIAVGRAPEIC